MRIFANPAPLLLRSLAWLTLACAHWCAVAAPFSIVTSNYPPFCFEDKGEQKGIAVDVVKEAFARMGMEVRIEFFPFPRAIARLKDGQVDAIFPFSIKEDRASYTLYPKEKLVEDTQTLFVRADSTITFGGDLKKMAPYTFGRQRDADNGPVFTDAMRSGIINQLDEAVDQRQNILKLVNGRFHIAIGPRLVVMHYARESGNQSAVKELYPAVDKPLAAYLGFSKQKGLEATAEHFDQTLRKMRQDGTYDRIVNRYIY